MHHSLTDAGLANALRADAEIGAARAAAAQNADPYSPLAGCFDRRFWAWKLTDYAEATFQRHVYPLSLLYRDPESRYFRSDAVLAAICRGLTFAAAIQHQNGSSDLAFPNEQSWGATAFLLQPLVDVSRTDHRAALWGRRGANRTMRAARRRLCARSRRTTRCHREPRGGRCARAHRRRRCVPRRVAVGARTSIAVGPSHVAIW